MDTTQKRAELTLSASLWFITCCLGAFESHFRKKAGSNTESGKASVHSRNPAPSRISNILARVVAPAVNPRDKKTTESDTKPNHT